MTGQRPLIVHLSDIHIHTYNRHDEYTYVFNNELYPKIKTLRDAHPDRKLVICVTGDVIHLKLSVSNELYQMTYNFIQRLIELSDYTIVTIGNHDYNEKNKDRADILTNISNQIANTELANKYKFCKYSEVFELYGITFSHLSIYDGQTYWTLAKDIPTPNPKVGLFHGMINGVVNEQNYQLSNEKVKASLFSDFDYLLLGDIHKPNQIVNNNSRWRYPGSLIQQDMGEAEYNKRGFLVWDMEYDTIDFVTIKQHTNFVTLHQSGSDCVVPNDIAENVRFRIMYDDNTSYEDRHNIETKLRQRYNVIGNVNFVPNKVISIDGDGTQDTGIELATLDVNEQNEMILSLNDISDNTKQDLIEINNTINSKVEHSANTHGIWHPLELSWSNLFTYGENNHINFDNLGGLVGIFANNSYGKSSIIEILLFLAFDKISKTNNNNDVLNAGETEYTASLTFKSNGVKYYIDKKGKRTKSSVKHLVDFYKYENGQKISLNGTNRIDTYKIISDYLGMYDDFLMTTLMTQFDNKGLIATKQTQRKTILRRFLGIEVFDKLYDVAKNEYNELKVTLKQHNLEYVQDEIAEHKAKINDIIEQIHDCNEQIDFTQHTISTKRKLLETKLASSIASVEDFKSEHEYKSLMSEYNDSITNAIKRNEMVAQQTKENDHAIAELTEKWNDANNKVNLLSAKLNELPVDHNREYELKNKIDIGTEVSKAVTDLVSQLKSFAEFNSGTIDNLLRLVNLSRTNNSLSNWSHYFDDIIELINSLLALSNDISQMAGEIDRHNHNISLLDQHEYDPECKYCTNNEFVLNAQQSIEIHKKLVPQLEELYVKEDDLIRFITNAIGTLVYKFNVVSGAVANKLSTLDAEYQQLKASNVEYDKLNTNVKSLHNHSMALSKELNDAKSLSYRLQQDTAERNRLIDATKNKLNTTKMEYNRFLKYKQVISQQNDLVNEINLIKTTIANGERELDDIRRQIQVLERNKTVNEVAVENNNMLVAKITELEYRFANYTLYMDLVKNTLPNLIIKQNIHILEQEINSVISELADFKLSFEYNNNDINIYTVKNGNKWSVELNGGMETFISSVAIRVGLLNVKRGAKTNFILIDEGIGVLDKSKLEKLPQVFEYLEARYDFALFISHLDIVKDMAATSLTISRADNKSKIVFN